MTVGTRLVCFLLALALIGCGSASSPLCDAGQLAAALDAAVDGDTVSVGACQVTGAFTVKAGVTLAGEDRTKSAIVAPSGKVAVTLEPGSDTTLSDISVRSRAARRESSRWGTGKVTLVDVDVDASGGIGVAVGIDPALRRSSSATRTITGPITLSSAPASPAPESATRPTGSSSGASARRRSRTSPSRVSPKSARC